MAGKNGRRMVSAFIATAFAQNDAAAAKAQWRNVADQLRPTLSKLAQFMDEAETDILAYMSFPKERWQKLYSTNGLERLNCEIKRRSEVVGIFPNEEAITRLVGAMLLEQNRSRRSSYATPRDTIKWTASTRSEAGRRRHVPRPRCNAGIREQIAPSHFRDC